MAEGLPASPVGRVESRVRGRTGKARRHERRRWFPGGCVCVRESKGRVSEAARCEMLEPSQRSQRAAEVQTSFERDPSLHECISRAYLHDDYMP